VRKILDDFLSKIKGSFSNKHILLYPFLWSYTPPKMGIKIRFLFSSKHSSKNGDKN